MLGDSFVGGGFWAWVTLFFEGTGFAFAICVAIVTGVLHCLPFPMKLLNGFEKDIIIQIEIVKAGELLKNRASYIINKKRKKCVFLRFPLL